MCNLAIASYARATLRPIARGIEIDAGGDTSIGDAALRHARLTNVRLEQTSEFPRGAGLGGSSAAGVAVAAAIAAWHDEPISRRALAERSRALEVGALGIAGGFQDHYAAALGGALALTFRERTSAEELPLSDALVTKLERQCLIAYTGESRISSATITAVLDGYRDRVPRVVKALARMKALASRMIDALRREDVDALGALVGEHWEHQRLLHPKITTPPIDALLETALAHGAIGGKSLGASGGGSVVIIAPEERVDEVRTHVSALARLLPFIVDRQGAYVTIREQAGRAAWQS